MKHYILVNPVSGNKKGLKYGIVVKKLLKKYNIDATIVVSEYPKHLTKLAKKLSSKHHCRFYSIGGDGTLNEVATGVIGSNSEIVVIPCGTGNDFMKSISQYMSLRKIIASSIGKEATPTDIIQINQTKYAINELNCGFDAMVAKNVDYFRLVPFITGKMKYNLAIFYTLLRNRNYKFKLRVQNEDDTKKDIIKKDNYTLVVIANGKYYGGGISPCPNANVTDGMLNICAIDATRVREKIILLPKYQKGKHTNLNKANLYTSKKVHLVSTKNFPVSIDGEVFYTNKLAIKVLPKKINIVHIT